MPLMILSRSATQHQVDWGGQTRKLLGGYEQDPGRIRQTGWQSETPYQVGESGVGLSFHEDRFGVFWVIYRSLGQIATLNRKTNRLRRYEYEWKIGSSRKILRIACSKTATERCGSEPGAGLMRFDRHNRRFISYRHEADDPETIGDNRVIALFEDGDGNIWAGLNQTEPNYFPIRPLPFENLTRLSHSRERQLSGLVTAIYEDGQGVVWLGVNRRLYRLNRKTGEVCPFQGVDNSEVYSTIPDGSDVLWFGNANPGLLRYNEKTGERRGYRHNRADPTTLCSGVIYHLLIDRKGALWSATWNGLCQLNSST